MLTNHCRVVRSSAVRSHPSRAVVSTTYRPIGTVDHPNATRLSNVRHTKGGPAVGCTSIAVVVVPIVTCLDTRSNMSITATSGSAIRQTRIGIAVVGIIIVFIYINQKQTEAKPALVNQEEE